MITSFPKEGGIKMGIESIIGIGLGLMSMNQQKKQQQAQTQAMQQASAGQNAMYEQIRQILNEQLGLWQTGYKPMELQALQQAGMLGQLPLPQITGTILQQLTAPYQLPPQIRQKMLEGIQTQEQRQMADMIRTLVGQGITGGQLAGSLRGLQEQFLPARFGMERDLAIEAASKEEARKYQAMQTAQAIMAQLQALGMGGRAIPGWATSTLGNIAGQYAMTGALAGQQQPQSNSWQNLGTTLANVFNTKPPAPMTTPPMIPGGGSYYPSSIPGPIDYMGSIPYMA